MKVVMCMCIWLIFCFPVFSSPVSLIGSLMVLSMMFVGLLSCFGSFWYSYILFLIYVGGLLVLFIYVCLVSSNISVKVDSQVFVYITLLSLCLSSEVSNPSNFLGFSSNGSGVSLVEESHISLFLFLVVLLLMMLLVVVRVSGIGSALLCNSKH